MHFDESDFHDFNRIDLRVESGLLVVRLVARNKFGEEWDISQASVPLSALMTEKR